MTRVLLRTVNLESVSLVRTIKKVGEVKEYRLTGTVEGGHRLVAGEIWISGLEPVGKV